jgi:hypothetical protein
MRGVSSDKLAEFPSTVSLKRLKCLTVLGSVMCTL